MTMKKAVILCNGVLFLWLCFAAFRDAAWLNGLRTEGKPRKETLITRFEPREPERIETLKPLFGGEPGQGRTQAGTGAGPMKDGVPTLETGTHIIRVQGLIVIPGGRMALIEISSKEAGKTSKPNSKEAGKNPKDSKQVQKPSGRELKKVVEGSQFLNLRVARISSHEIVFENVENGQQFHLIIFKKNSMES
jgi:hypothetical protein